MQSSAYALERITHAATPTTMGTLRKGQVKQFPRSWGVPPLARSQDYVIWPYGYGAGASTIADWIEENVQRDSQMSVQSARSTPSLTEMEGSTRSVSGQRRQFPAHWGDPPTVCALDFKKWPAGYGVGSSTIGQWIEENMEKDAAAGKSPAANGSTSASTALAQSPADITPTMTPTTTTQTPRTTPRRPPARTRSEGPRKNPPSASLVEKSEFSLDHSLAGSLCVRLNRRIQQVLLYELEEKLIKQVAFLVSCLHCWRIETKKAELYKQIEAKDAELLVNTQKFNEHLAKLEAFHDEKLQSAAAERLAKRKRMFELLYAEWAEGDARGLIHVSWRCWCEYTLEARAYRAHKEKTYVFGSLLSRFAEGEEDGALHLAMYVWKEYCREYVQAARHQNVVERIALRWYELEEGKLQTIFMTWKGIMKHRQLALRTLAMGSPRTLVTNAFRAWVHYLQASWQQAAKLKVVKQAAFRWAEGSSGMMVRTAFQAMAAEAKEGRHHANLRKYQEECQSYLNGIRAEHEAAERDRLSAAQKRKERSHMAVELIIAQWGRGQAKGLLQTVHRTWRTYARNTAVRARAKASVHLAVQKALEGPIRGLKHSVFGHWKTEAMQAKHEQIRGQHEANQRAAFERLLVDERQKHEEQLGALKMKASAQVHEAILKWGFGDSKGSYIEVFQEWAKYVKETKKHGRMRQAVHSAILSAFAGKAKGNLQMCFKNWAALRRRKPSKAVLLAVKKFLEGDTRGLKDTVFTSWHQICHSRLQHVQSRFFMVQMMGDKDARALKLECFLAWQAAWQMFLHEQRHQALLQGFDDERATFAAFQQKHLQAHFRRGEVYLCRTFFWEWHTEARNERHAREVQDAWDQRKSLEEQLVLANFQVENLSESLEKELKSKEDLMAKLHAAYAQLRQRTLQASPGPIKKEVDEMTEGRKSLGRSSIGQERMSTTPSEAGSVAKDTLASSAGLRKSRMSHDAEDGELCTWDNAYERMSHGGLEVVRVSGEAIHLPERKYTVTELRKQVAESIGVKGNRLRLVSSDGEILKEDEGASEAVFGVITAAVVRPPQALVEADSGELQIWDVHDMSCSMVWSPEASCKPVIASIVSNFNSTLVAVGTIDGLLWLWDFSESCCIARCQAHSKAIWALSCDFQAPLRAITGSSDDEVRIWDLSATPPQCLQKLLGHTSDIFDVCAKLSLGVIVSASDDATLRVWDVSFSPNAAASCRGVLSDTGVPCAVHMDTHAKRALSAAENGMLCMWDLDRLELLHSFGRRDLVVSFHGLTVDFEAGYAIAWNHSGQVHLWNIVTMTHAGALPHTDRVEAVVMDFSLKIALVGTDSGKILWVDLDEWRVTDTTWMGTESCACCVLCLEIG